MLIRFDGTDIRGPSASLWQGIVDWVRGSLSAEVGQSDFEDYAPYLGDDVGQEITSATGSPTTTVVTTEPFGVINLTEGAAANESLGVAREIWYTLADSPLTVVEARLEQNADANSPQVFVGLADAADPDDVFATSVIASGGNEDTIGLRWNADETIDIVVVDDGTLTVVKDDIGVTVERTDGVVKLGLRIEQITSTLYRLVPSVNGTIARQGIVNVASTGIPANPMRPVAVTTVNGTTDPDIDLDWIYSASK